MTSAENIYENEIRQIVSDTFQMMLGTEVCVMPEALLPEPDGITASVAFRGDWQGTLAFECGRLEAALFAQRLLQCDDQSKEDISDAVGELANIIAGNLKPVLPANLTLDSPCVVQGDPSQGGDGSCKVVSSTAFTTDAGIFCVRIFEHDDTKRGER
jgi:CheY-specific phosphatase CheX